MARFASTFGLNHSQAELDFVDVDTARDNRLYLDPYAIQIRNDEWSGLCRDHMQSFFGEVLDSLRAKNRQRTLHLMSNLHEPNETCLGQSVGEPSGRGVGPNKADDLAAALQRSRAFETGLLTDISETELFVRNIGPDTVSDLTTNVLRGVLAEYTLRQCELLRIPTQEIMALGATWSIERSDWVGRPLHLPVSNDKPILLVPKFSIRRSISLNSQEFYNHHMTSFLQQEYLDSRSALVQTFKDGTPYVTKKSVKERHPLIKDDLASFVQKHPEILEEYKRLKGAQGAPMSRDLDEEFDERVFARVLIERLVRIPLGNAAASEYHGIMMGICTFLFYPHLICPVKERELHEGRKRVDIKFTNAAEQGFFLRMLQANQTRAIGVMVECKNYTNDINNPELDQLAGRFGHQRGFFGILFCRRIENRDRLTRSCRDTASDNRGYMLVFNDIDVTALLELVESGQREGIENFLQQRFDAIAH